jgi:phosphatidylserine/phosphatidylglycerophosphate/cardiolipin synthase-like enzyme
MRAKNTTDGLTLQAIAGTHVVGLGLDLAAEQRGGCLGFAIQREDHTEGERWWMTGMKTFEATDPGLGPGGQVSSREHPFQSFQWADYSAKPNHDYTYRVIALGGSPEHLEEGPTTTVSVTTEPEGGARHSVFFNRGSAASQEYARRFQNKSPKDLEGEEQAAAYRWLSRGLFEAFVTFVERASGPDYGLLGAIYQFQLPEALAALKAAHAAGATVQIVYDAIPGKSSPRADNENAITEAHIKSLCKPRTTGTIMHNKFLVLTHHGTPVAVWTGSTNLTENGVFGHSNVGHAIEDPTLAQAYLDYWHELGTNPVAKTEKAWVDAQNPVPASTATAALTQVFSPHSKLQALELYAELAGSAQDALFMTFAFGMHHSLQTVYEQRDDTLRFALMDKEGAAANLAQAKKDILRIRKLPNVVVAVGNKIVTNSFDRWLAERGGLKAGVQWIHDKFMLVDPLGTDPVVVTGSANFSEPSTTANNENMLIIRGDRRVADIYLGEFMRLYSHYAFREAVKIARENHETDWHPQHLIPDPSWQDEYYAPGGQRFLRRRYFAGI